MNAIELIKAERERQVSAEGWTAEHDDQHSEHELARAAVCYTMPPFARNLTASTNETGDRVPLRWPWNCEWWKPSPQNRVRELVKAGALIAAEIDRLQRAGAEAPAHPLHNNDSATKKT